MTTLTPPPMITGYPRQSTLTNVTPLTFRDGDTLLLRLERLRSYVTTGLVPELETILGTQDESTAEQITALVNEVNTTVQAMASYVDAEVATIIGSSVEVQDPVIEALISDLESLTGTALNGRFAAKAIVDTLSGTVAEQATAINENNEQIATLETGVTARTVARVWNGTAYPSRVDGSTNIFFGETDPGLLMGPEDFWALTDSTTLETIISEATDATSELFTAIQTATTGNSVDLPLFVSNVDPAPYKNAGVAGSAMCGFEMSATVTGALFANVTIPYGWNNARIRLYYYIPAAAGAGDVRAASSATPYKANAAPGATVVTSNTIIAPVVGQVGSVLLTNDIPVTGMTQLSIQLRRDGGSGVDTLNSVVYYLSARLERMS